MARRQSRMQRLTGSLPDFDATTLGIGLAVVLLALVFALPHVYPGGRDGPSCTDLAAPLGGNQRSLLAYSRNDKVHLGLELDLPDSTIPLSSPYLDVELVFVNKDIGPAILYMSRSQPLLTRDNATMGVNFEITSVLSTDPLGDGVTPPETASTIFSSEQLHLLGSRARCSQEYTLDLTRVFPALQPGEYRIRAIYRNDYPGTPQHAPNATATPAFPNSQGVWTGEITSEERRFTVAPG